MTALDSAPYVVPDHGFGVIHNLPIADVSPEIFSDLLEATASEAGYLSAELGPRTANQGFAISVGDFLIGHLSTADSQAYALFDWILGAGLHPRPSRIHRAHRPRYQYRYRHFCRRRFWRYDFKFSRRGRGSGTRRRRGHRGH